MKIKIFKEFGRRSELKCNDELYRSEIEDFLNDNRLQDSTVKRIVGLIGSKIPLITIKKRGGRAKNGDLMVFAGLSDRMMGVLGGGGFGGCLGENSARSGARDRARSRTENEAGDKGKEEEKKDEGMVIHCKFVRASYIGEGIVIKVGGKMKELLGSGRTMEQTKLALKRGSNIVIRYVDDYNWGVL